MPLDRQLFRRTIAEALTELLGQKYRTAKVLAKHVGIDPATAENLRKGHLSVPTLEKLFSAEGRELWERLGEEIWGESALQYNRRKIEAQLKQAQNEHSNIYQLCAQADAVLASAPSLDASGYGPVSAALGEVAGGSWSEDGQGGREAAQGARIGGAQ